MFWYILLLGRHESVKALDHDRGPPPAAPSRQEHGLREVLQHGAVPLHKVLGLAV